MRLEIAEKYTAEAYEYLKKGDTIQASGKAYKVAEEIVKAIKFLISKLIGQDVGVISPYRTQVRKLDQELANYKPYVEVNTVDAFQGREKDVIIFSVTATNGLRFVTNRRRLNVAFTRPRYKLIVLGNENSIMSCQMTIC
ncbi:hypothetical protein HFC64_02085 [Saccharolobus solfataricus]|uniref:DNA2/NAM7 helicase-like C-terminal domain-containing protein n=1 Tax=Saccharolobus solfataricus TaxID=2287 RepID=A0A7S9NQB9_SACSO|nr:hypothetical protein HFC64_02085 [Saccharolobus solfataricus]